MTELVLASRNPGKARELSLLLDIPGLVVRSVSELLPAEFIVDETGATFSENAWLKAEAVCRATRRLTVSDDSGLEVDALNGQPGVHSARFAGSSASDDDNNDLLLARLAGVPPGERRARFRVVLALAAWHEDQVVRVAESQGVLEGSIALGTRGSQGFGYDCVFEPTAHPGLTTAELTLSAKNELSHRGQAARALKPALQAWLASSSAPASQPAQGRDPV